MPDFLLLCTSLVAGIAAQVAGALPDVLSLFGDVVAQTAVFTSTVTPTPTPIAESPFTLPLPRDVMVRGLTLGAVSFLIGLMIGRPVINWLRDRRIGKSIRIEGPASHQIKTGTPTMGGIIFLIPLIIV
ncbi:MAG TPA: hypothetical protein VND68_12005, partial [Chloroflexia bacterium]|nr:hypothetical protein [Chloroflexia bacterium]